MGEPTISYSNLVSIILKEMNKVRKNPPTFIPYLRERVANFAKDNDKLYIPISGQGITIETKEGVSNVQNLIMQLQVMPVCPSLIWSYELHCAANIRAQQLSDSIPSLQKSTGIPGDVGSQMQIDQLVNRYANWKGQLSQHILYGFIDPRDLISQMLIDDGNKEKQHRKQFFNSQMRYIGIGINEHSRFSYVVVLIFAQFAGPKIPQREYIMHQEGCGDNCKLI